MYVKRPTRRRTAYTLIELLVVIAIILALSALAAAFLPRISGSQNLTRSMDQLEQWLLSAKMRAKRDGLPTGLRFNPDPNNPGMFAEVQYIQQPEPLSGGSMTMTGLNGGILQTAGSSTVNFANVDFTNGQPGVYADYLVQPGDFLEVHGGGGVYLIGPVVAGPTKLTLSGSAYDKSLVVATPTTNYRILRQPRLLTGEAPLELPNNFDIDVNNSSLSNIPFRTVLGAPVPWPGAPLPLPQTGGYYEILFSPTGAVVGTGASNGKIYFFVHEIGQTDPNQAGIIAVQTRTGFIGAYNVAPGTDPLAYAEEGRSSGM